ncbi:S-layer homology domain-containing protein [Aminipila sp.]|uniref:S-layer homology domain-containing protein n=1 Tax=Aminipila sp. TaxID=2060095 RepID=UPI0028A1F24D|nr:S-layer homology domain-containing protein [Aminipila sp.]
MMLNFAAYLKKTEATSSSLAYVDSASISSWATDGAKYCQETKVITGREGSSFIPQGNATRAEVAAVITRFIQTIVK